VLPKIQSNTIAEHRAEITGFPLHRDARASATTNTRNSHTELVQIIDIYYKPLILFTKVRWDGWDSSYRIKYLISRLFYLAVRIDAPANAPSKCWLPPDISGPPRTGRKFRLAQFAGRAPPLLECV
jgi:hypothetical protein